MNRFDSTSRKGPALAALTFAALFSVLAHAPARAAELTPAQKLEMKQLYERATRAYDVAKYGEAIEYYQKAYEIGGDPPMLYNIAQSYRLNDQPGEAVRFYRRYLQRAPTARNKDDVERKIAELEKVAEDRRVKAAAVAPPPAPVAPLPTPVAPSPPPPNVAVGPPSPVVENPSSGAVGISTTPAQSAADEESKGTRRIIGWSLVGVGVAAGVGAVIFGTIAKQQSDKVTEMSQHPATMPVTFDPELEKKGKNANAAAIGLAIGAGAATIAGVILVVTAWSSGETPPAEPTSSETARATVTPWLGAGIVGAGADFRF
jgi:Tetratricopeptide repeat